jgi:cell division septation protein DedD
MLSLTAASAFSQTPVNVDVRVLELPRIDLDRVGTLPIRTSIAKPVSAAVAESLLSGPRSKTIYKLELPASSGKSTQFHVDSRIPLAMNSDGEVVSFFEIGIGIDVSPKVTPGRDIALSTSSQVRVRRGPAVNGGLPVVFETVALRYETRVREGETAVLGGFISDVERASLPMISPLPDNPILSYVFGRKREQQVNAEVVILLTPHIEGPITDPIFDVPIVVSNIQPVPVFTSPAPATSMPVVQEHAFAAPVLPPVPVVVNPPSMLSALPEPREKTVKPVLQVAAVSIPVRTAPATKSPHATQYTVQVGAFDDSEKAEALVRKLTQKKYETVFIDKLSNSKATYHVRVGRFAEMKIARELEKKLQKDGFGTFVTTAE